MITEFVLGIAIILLTGLLFGKIAKKLRIPNVTGYLFGGLVIGPALARFIPHFSGVLGWDLIATLNVVVDIELGFIAFTVGSEFKASYLKQVGPMPVIVAFAESLAAVLFVTLGVSLIGLALGVPFYFALCLGAVAGATAPAATILVIKQYRARGPFAQTLLSVVAVDDMSSLIYFGIAIAIVKSLIGSSSGALMSIVWPVVEILVSCALGVVSGILLTVLVRFFKSSGNRLVLTTSMIFLNIGICLLVKRTTGLALTPLLACMAMGAIFTNKSRAVEEVIPLVESITPPLVVIFFVISGAGLNIEALRWQAIVILVVYLTTRIAGKIIGTSLSAKACKVDKKVRNLMGFGLLPQGGIAIGLSLLVMQMLNDMLPASKYADSIFNGEMLRAIILCAVFISEFFGPILCKLALIKSGEADPATLGKTPPSRAATEPTPSEPSTPTPPSA